MKKLIFLGMGILVTLSLTANTIYTDISSYTAPQSDEITAIINKDTTEKELKDLQTFFSENGIELILKKTIYNEQNQLTGLSIVLKKGNSKSQYSSSSNIPISEIELGYKNGNLYITNSGGINGLALALGNQSMPKMNLDSIMKQHNFAFDFDFDENDESMMFFNGHLDIQKLKDQIMQSFSFDQDENGAFIFDKQNKQPQTLQNLPKFNFVDNPDIDKLIVIDGVEQDFETLDQLAKSDQLAEVDFLRPKTAISLYGEKAKDGAIIATTK